MISIRCIIGFEIIVKNGLNAEVFRFVPRTSVQTI